MDLSFDMGPFDKCMNELKKIHRVGNYREDPDDEICWEHGYYWTFLKNIMVDQYLNKYQIQYFHEIVKIRERRNIITWDFYRKYDYLQGDERRALWQGVRYKQSEERKPVYSVSAITERVFDKYQRKFVSESGPIVVDYGSISIAISVFREIYGTM